MKYNLLLFVTVVFITFLHNAYSQQQPENPGFENWEQFGFGPDTLEPVGWNSLKSSDGGIIINNVIPVTLKRSTDAHSGMYSVKLENDTILIFVAPGTITNGRVHATLPPSDAYVYTIDSLPEFNTPFTDKPDSMAVWVKYFPQDNDLAHVTAVLHSDTAKIADSTQTDWIAVASIGIPSQIDGWTRLAVPFVYLNNQTPEYVLFAIFAGDAANSKQGSILYLDDLEFIYNNTSVNTNSESCSRIYLSGDYLVFQSSGRLPDGPAELMLYDITGRMVMNQQFVPVNTNKIKIDLPAGVYMCRITGPSVNLSQKIIKY